ncbi:MAG: hypothetical protein ACTSRG_26880, partial [Candidatus Helarchaeota archaeon]
MNNSKAKIGIICPLDDEYDTCKEILGLKNESELSGRIFSERKENNIEMFHTFASEVTETTTEEIINEVSRFTGLSSD